MEPSFYRHCREPNSEKCPLHDILRPPRFLSADMVQLDWPCDLRCASVRHPDRVANVETMRDALHREHVPRRWAEGSSRSPALLPLNG